MSKLPLLNVEALSFERDDVSILSDVTFSVSAGQIVQIEGANGSGKTTLLRLLTTALSPDSGTLNYNGDNIKYSRYELRSDLLFIGHHSGVKGVLSARENLSSNFAVGGGDLGRRVASALEDVGLSGYEDVACHRLSAGQQRRVALARLQITDAKLWFLDEPLAALDTGGIELLRQWMTRHVRAGGAVVMSTHQPLSIDGMLRLRLSKGVPGISRVAS